MSRALADVPIALATCRSRPCRPLLDRLRPARAQDDANQVIDPAHHVGPVLSQRGALTGAGRVTAVAGVPDEPYLFYMGSTGGGIYKTEDAGNDVEQHQRRSDRRGLHRSHGGGSLGCERALRGHRVGRAPRGNTSPGRGMYRSTDAGKTWHFHRPAEQAGQIGRVVVHPERPGCGLCRRPWEFVRAGTTSEACSAPETAVSQLGEPPVRQRFDGHRGPCHGPHQPPDPVRHRVARTAPALDHDLGVGRRRHLPEQRRRRDLGAAPRGATDWDWSVRWASPISPGESLTASGP